MHVKYVMKRKAGDANKASSSLRKEAKKKTAEREIKKKRKREIERKKIFFND